MTARLTHRSVLIQADGGSRGNPGKAAYGAVLSDADTGEVIAEDGSTIGIATNNVAEYAGLIAGLRLAAEFAPDADIEVRMDSKLVVEQMSGNWKIKHPDMKPLAMQAHQLAPFGTRYTWVPRERNKYADRLANEALDGLRSGVTIPSSEPEGGLPSAALRTSDKLDQQAAQGWSNALGPATTLILVRHGATDHTNDKRFSGGLASANPGLNDEGRAQMRATADWLSPIAGEIDGVVSSPVRRTTESARILAERWHLPVAEERRFAEMEFGHWDGLTYAEVAERHPEELAKWRASLDVKAGGGESFKSVRRRVRAGLRALLDTCPGQTIALVSHVTPIKILVADALGAPLDAVFRMELSPASVSVIAFFPGEHHEPSRPSLRLFNAQASDSEIRLD